MIMDFVVSPKWNRQGTWLTVSCDTRRHCPQHKDRGSWTEEDQLWGTMQKPRFCEWAYYLVTENMLFFAKLIQTQIFTAHWLEAMSFLPTPLLKACFLIDFPDKDISSTASKTIVNIHPLKIIMLLLQSPNPPQSVAKGFLKFSFTDARVKMNCLASCLVVSSVLTQSSH